MSYVLGVDQKLTNIYGLAILLRIPRWWLVAEADAGRIPFLEVGRGRLFNVEAVRDALAKRASEPCEREVPR